MIPCKDCLLDPICLDACDKFKYRNLTNFEFLVNNKTRYIRFMSKVLDDGQYTYHYTPNNLISIVFRTISYTVQYLFPCKISYNIQGNESKIVHGIRGMRYSFYGNGSASYFLTYCNSYIRTEAFYSKSKENLNCHECLEIHTTQNKYGSATL